jgi:type I restriction enzyme S subunit
MSWPELAVGVVCDVRRGTTITQTQARQGNIPVVAGGLNATYYHDTPNRLGNVVTISASGASAGYVNFWSTPIFASDCSTVESDGKKVDVKFVYHFLRSKQEYINSKLRSGAAQPHVYAKDIAQLLLPLPPLPEQRRIAAILDQADALRTKRREALAQLDNLTQSIFIEMFGDLSTNSKNWDVVRLSDEVSVQGGFAFKSSDYVASGIPLIRIGDVNRGSETYESPCFLPKNLAGIYSRFLIHPGSLLMSLTGTTGKDDYGNVVILNSQFNEYFLNQRVACIKPIGTRVSKAFLHSFLKNGKIKAQIVAKSRGVRQANISNGDILELMLPLPPHELQSKYSESVDRLESLKMLHKKSAFDFDALFASLQHRAFRGEL